MSSDTWKINKGRVKKNDNFRLGGGEGLGSAGVNYHFLFFVPNVLKITSRHKSFFKYRGRGAGASQAPLWSLANIQCVAAYIMQGATNILHGATIILCSMARILSNVPEVLHVKHQFLNFF